MKINTAINTLGKLRTPKSKVELKKIITKIFSFLLKMPAISSNSPVLQKLAAQQITILGLELTFCDNETIREINRDYRNKDKATDVITFALFADDENAVIINNTAELGEIIISIDTLISQAQENKNTVETELYTLITHGILHLLGFDHLTQKDYDFVVNTQEATVKNL